MEQIHAHRDQTTREFHNKIDSSRQRDSGLKGMIHSTVGSDPTATARKWRKEFHALPLPPSIKEMGDAGLAGLEVGTKLGKWLRQKV